MSKTKVSVVTTVYNGEDFINRGVNCILNQTYRDFEFIIINDGSSDNTLKLLKQKENEDSRIKVISPGRLGFAKALNYAIENASGEFIVRHDIDDISYEDRIEKQVEFLESNPNYGVTGCYYLLIDHNRGEKYKRMPPLEDQEIKTAFAKYIPIAHTLATFRKQAWLDTNGYPEANNLVDLRFWKEIAKRGWKFKTIPYVLGEHYVYGGSFWHKSFKYADRQKDLSKVQSEVIKELNLPMHMKIYPMGRRLYSYLPKNIKRVVRRSIGGSKEKDI